MADGQSLPKVITLKNGKQVPVYWRKTGYITKEKSNIDELIRRAATGEDVSGIPTQKSDVPYEIWIPILPLGQFSPNELATLWRNIYANEIGTNTFEPISPSDIGLDWETFSTTQPYLSFEAYFASDPAMKGIWDTPSIQDYIYQQSQKLLTGNIPDVGRMSQELGKLQAYPDYINELRQRGEAAGDVDEAYIARGQQRGEALQEAFGGGAPETFSEEERLRNQIDKLGYLAEEYEKKIATGVVDPQKLGSLEDQRGVAAVETIRKAQARLAEIERYGQIENVLSQPANVADFGQAILKQEQVGIKPPTIYEEEGDAASRELALLTRRRAEKKAREQQVARLREKYVLGPTREKQRRVAI